MAHLEDHSRLNDPADRGESAGALFSHLFNCAFITNVTSEHGDFRSAIAQIFDDFLSLYLPESRS